MRDTDFVSPDQIRSWFAQAMSDMYRAEVPLYGDLMSLVAQVNAQTLQANPALAQRLQRNDERARLDLERHGAIRVGTAAELATLRRLFAVLGMQPVGYYDLSVAGVPVHSTAFRPIDEAALSANPFRVFTSLLRLELIEDAALRAQAEQILQQRQIFTAGALQLIERHERQGGLDADQARQFVAEALETFRWHGDATVSLPTYRALSQAHKLIADVVSFHGPHINHLTPRTLDIDAAQEQMQRAGIDAKAVIEGPPRRRVPILLRQTSFKALEEPVRFVGDDGQPEHGTHTARFGEIEQRGLALTPKGRALYDALLAQARDADGAGSTGTDYATRLQTAFVAFPDDEALLRQEGLGYFRYTLTDAGRADPAQVAAMPAETAIALGLVSADPIIYEDFLPVSAAGIFQSNLGGAEQRAYAAHSSKRSFEQALGAQVHDEFALYAQLERESLQGLLV
ncbi:2-oxoadipate dioxygenase/decarboxylase HglS [Xanthomonas phaseoli]|uniref:2-oxoadipate dioxygenase/decarboxylase n=2 Tax=Xanthomonas TaxID=338 RepID=A0A1V9H854_9XANT|nr:VOC family protein [Xanthomonas phaseoli]MBO9787353.1 VOC family protein [Xanthomonas phaseoli pv. dieffenbachiae]MBO9831826.1 VOC family protein [Xanthomonas phaseoli pv. dieffenbachiae]MBO9835773.1 VOC family protein [Xanthomonas phaseoli pv. dieffenbachiae]MBO9840652.1 VOC family protein [Xanthomonas phaseoli pv. dieffenbachiae]MBO9851252.1 VOC family protein [Xanthomonas phaseoli pv. dieffenbachiae]